MEYSICYDRPSLIEACASAKVEDGWMPLGGVAIEYNAATGGYGGTPTNGLDTYKKVSQAFWRFAQ